MNWINVKDRLPEEIGEYLVYKDGRVFSSRFRFGKIYKRYANGFFIPDWPSYNNRERKESYNPTHWQPLPDPPEEE